MLHPAGAARVPPQALKLLELKSCKFKALKMTVVLETL